MTNKSGFSANLLIKNWLLSFVNNQRLTTQKAIKANKSTINTYMCMCVCRYRVNNIGINWLFWLWGFWHQYHPVSGIHNVCCKKYEVSK